MKEKIFVCNSEKDQLEKYQKYKNSGYDVVMEWKFNKRCVIIREKESK